MAMQFVFTPVQGALSDRFGRRPVILLSNLGLGLDFLLMALVNTLPLLFIGRIISGITAASFTTANAYVADVTPPEKRAASFGMIGMAFGIGFVIAPAIGGFLGDDRPAPAVLGRGRCCALTNFCTACSCCRNRCRRKSARRASTGRTPIRSARCVLLRRYPQVFGLVGGVVPDRPRALVYPSTFVLYADYRFGWGPQMVGYTLAGVGVLAAIVQGGLIKKIVGALGERRALLLGPRLRHARLRAVWPGAERPLVLGGDAARRAVGRARTGGAGDDDAPGRSDANRADLQGAVASLVEHRRHLRADVVHALVRGGHRLICTTPGPASRSASRRCWSASPGSSRGAPPRTCRRRTPASTPATIVPAVVSDADDLQVQPADSAK